MTVLLPGVLSLVFVVAMAVWAFVAHRRYERETRAPREAAIKKSVLSYTAKRSDTPPELLMLRRQHPHLVAKAAAK